MAKTDKGNASQWASIIDAILADCSVEPLGDTHNPDEYFSALSAPPLTEILLADVIEKEKETYEIPAFVTRDESSSTSRPETFHDAAQYIFYPQMTFEESFHAVPVPPNFSSAAAERATSLTVSELSQMPPEGPALYEKYRLTNSAMGSSASPTSKRRRREISSPSGASPNQSSIAPFTSVPSMRSVTARRLGSGFVNPLFYSAVHRQPDFFPIIFVPSSVDSPVQLFNVKQFLEKGVLIDSSEYFVDQQTGAVNVRQAKPEFQLVSAVRFKLGLSTHVAFNQFRVVDDVSQVEDWNHVCAALVTGEKWQFNHWFPSEDPSLREPSRLFSRIAGYFPYFQEDRIPKEAQQWRVTPLLLTRRLEIEQQHIREASKFWETLFAFLDRNPLFNRFTVPVDF